MHTMRIRDGSLIGFKSISDICMFMITIEEMNLLKMNNELDEGSTITI
jgi:hypothetical protein